MRRPVLHFVLSVMLCGFVIPSTVFSQNSLIELWFDKGQDSTAINKGLVGMPNPRLSTGVKAGDGETKGPVWSEETPFNYEDNHSLYFSGSPNPDNVWVGVGERYGIGEIESFSIEAWIKPEDPASAAGRQDILIVRDSVRQVMIFRLNQIDGVWRLENYLWDNQQSGWQVMRSSEDSISLDVWQHVSLVYDVSMGAKLFHDGVEIATLPVLGDLPSFDGSWWISNPGTFAFKGWIDEFRVTDIPKIPGDGSGSSFNLAWDSTFTYLAVPPPVLSGPEDSVSVSDSVTTLSWESEPDAEYYRVQVTLRSDYRYTQIDSSDIDGTSIDFTLPDTIFFGGDTIDTSKESVTYYWRVGAVNDYGTSNWSESRAFIFSPSTGVSWEQSHIKDFALMQNYPNPFNPATTIQYNLAKDTPVEISVYNLNGKQVDKLVNTKQKAGRHVIDYNAEHLPSGIYFYQIQTRESKEMKKMILLK